MVGGDSFVIGANLDLVRRFLPKGCEYGKPGIDRIRFDRFVVAESHHQRDRGDVWGEAICDAGRLQAKRLMVL